MHWKSRALLRSNSAIGWQWLHRLVYFAAALTLVHWIYVHNNAVAAWVHFAPLIVLEGYRVFRAFSRRAADG